MKKETLLEIILGTVGGLIFAIGMCMGLIPEWNMLKLGIVVAFLDLLYFCVLSLFIGKVIQESHMNL